MPQPSRDFECFKSCKPDGLNPDAIEKEKLPCRAFDYGRVNTKKDSKENQSEDGYPATSNQEDSEGKGFFCERQNLPSIPPENPFV